MDTELPLCMERETDRFILLMMQVSIEYAAQLKALQRSGITSAELSSVLLEKFDVLDLEEIYARVGPEIIDGSAMTPYLKAMFADTMIDASRIANFAQLEGAVACLMICSWDSQAFNKRFFKCWNLVERNSVRDINSFRRRKIYDRIAAGDGSALIELNEMNARFEQRKGSNQAESGVSARRLLRFSVRRFLAGIFSLPRLLLLRFFALRCTDSNP